MRAHVLVLGLVGLAVAACDFGRDAPSGATLEANPARASAAGSDDDFGDVQIQIDAGTTYAVTPSGEEAGRADGPCESYCATVHRACTGANAQYPTMATCIAVCRLLPRGVEGASPQNSVACRLNAARRALAGADRPTCDAAGMTGGEVCGTRCESFCLLSAQVCGGDAGATSPFASEAACRGICGPTAQFAFDATRGELAREGQIDDLNCRLAYLADALVDGLAGNATRACPALGPKDARGAVCVN